MSETKVKTFFGHPIGLSTLFATEMWERFSYYGMRAILVYYLMATFAKGGFNLGELDAYTIYGIFTGLVYVTPLFGGMLADKLLGQRKSIFIGGITMAIGHFLLAFSAMTHTDVSGMETLKGQLFLFGLGILILGNGFFKPNISTMVGDLYDNHDPKKDSGFTIFYMGINLGAFIAPFIAGALGENIAWQYGFMAAGTGMVIGTIWFLAESHILGHIGLPPKAKLNAVKLMLKDWMDILVYVVVIVGGIVGLVLLWGILGNTVQKVIIYIIAIVGGTYLIRNIIIGTSGKMQWGKVSVILVLSLFNIFFWSGFEQAGTTFSVFALENTNRMIGSWEIPASWFQSINALFILLFAPLFSILWTKLDKLKMNPNTPMKFAWGLILLALGFVVMAFANNHAAGGHLVSPLWLVSVFMIHTFGELCLSPIGLSMVTKLSPTKIVSTMMGIWFGTTAAGTFVASQMKAISIGLSNHYHTEIPVFWFIAAEAGIAAILLIALSPLLKKLMGDIK